MNPLPPNDEDDKPWDMSKAEETFFGIEPKRQPSLPLKEFQFQHTASSPEPRSELIWSPLASEPEPQESESESFVEKLLRKAFLGTVAGGILAFICWGALKLLVFLVGL